VLPVNQRVPERHATHHVTVATVSSQCDQRMRVARVAGSYVDIAAGLTWTPRLTWINVTNEQRQ